MTWKGFKDIQATILIGLTKSEKELWDSADKDAKWGVKKAEKEGLVVKEVESKEEINKFYEIYKETCRYGGINPEPLQNMLDKKPLFFLCYKEDLLIAGSAIIIESNEKFRLFKNASHHQYLKYQPNNLLYWCLIMWGKKNNFKIFDLGGYQLNAQPGDKLYSINRFKERWGGKIENYYVYSYNPLYILGRKAIRNFRFFRWLNNKIRGRD